MINQPLRKLLGRLGEMVEPFGGCRPVRAAVKGGQEARSRLGSIPVLIGILVGFALTFVAFHQTFWGSKFSEASGWWEASGTILGLAFIWFQIDELRRNAKGQERAARSQLYRGASDGMARINEVFFRYPWLRSFFYDGRPADEIPEASEVKWGERAGQVPDEATLRVLTENVGEMFADFADDLLEQYGTIPDELDWSTWWSYLRFIYAHSPSFREFMDGNVEFYPDYLHAVFGHVIVRDPHSRRLLGRWSAYPVSASAEGKEDSRRLQVTRRQLSAFGRLAAEDPTERRYPWYGRWYLELLEWSSPHSCNPGVFGTNRDGSPAPAIVASILPETDATVNLFVAWPREVACLEGCAGDGDGEEVRCDLQRKRAVVTSWLIKLLDRSGTETVQLHEAFPGEAAPRHNTTYDMRQLGLFCKDVTYHLKTYQPADPPAPWLPRRRSRRTARPPRATSVLARR